MTGGAGAADENGGTSSSDILKSGGLEANSETRTPETSSTCRVTQWSERCWRVRLYPV